MMSSREVEAYRLDLRERVIRLETVLDRIERHLSILNDRTVALEQWRYWMSGGMALLGLLIAIGIGVL